MFSLARLSVTDTSLHVRGLTHYLSLYLISKNIFLNIPAIIMNYLKARFLESIKAQSGYTRLHKVLTKTIKHDLKPFEIVLLFAIPKNKMSYCNMY